MDLTHCWLAGELELKVLIVWLCAKFDVWMVCFVVDKLLELTLEEMCKEDDFAGPEPFTELEE